ncbi:hypothetical protein [Microbacterium sp. No. 7]|nr:hypothetical protein [Microbacterium sp. No. 7]
MKPAAWLQPRVDYCYDCIPGGPFAPPLCRRCGSSEYYSQGLCAHCHPGSPGLIGSCRDCLAWGVYRNRNWRCPKCRWWFKHYPQGECVSCHRDVTIGEQGYCRLCLETARMLQVLGEPLDLDAPRKFGAQLFFAVMNDPRRPAEKHRPMAMSLREAIRLVAAPPPVAESTQPVLFDLDPDPERVRQRSNEIRRRDITSRTDHFLYARAAEYAWSKRQTNQVRRTLKILQLVFPGANLHFRASDILAMRRYDDDGNIRSTIEVLGDADLLIDDRVPTFEQLFDRKTRHLPEPMRSQLELWRDIMADGSKTTPRRQPRDTMTVKGQMYGILPAITRWVEEGRTSLTGISTEDILDALPDDPSRQHTMMLGFRTLFTILRGRKIVFADPTKPIPLRGPKRTIPLPMEKSAIRDALTSPDPAIALAVALVAFHALTTQQVQHVQLTDIIDGRLRMPDGRTIPLAEPVRVRLAAWLDHRATRWPETKNPYLLVTIQTAPRLSPPGRNFPWKKAGVTAQALRTDRILYEVEQTGGDVRRICDLFGIGIDTALRYAHPARVDRPVDDGGDSAG